MADKPTIAELEAILDSDEPGRIVINPDGSVSVAEKPRLVAVLGGGDWADASVDHLVIPVGVDLEAAKQAYQQWYREVYCTQPNMYVHAGVPDPDRIEYLTFTAWLQTHHGAREATESDIEVFQDD